jgi:hypothetical protein
VDFCHNAGFVRVATNAGKRVSLLWSNRHQKQSFRTDGNLPIYTTVQTIDLAKIPTLVPPVRLGSLLMHARVESNLSFEGMEAKANGRFSIGDLRLLESGSVAVSDEDIEAAAVLYGIDLTQSTRGPAELVVDRSEGLLAIGEQERMFTADDNDRDIMVRYLSLVYRLRNSSPGQILPARTGDLDVLSQVFGSTPEQVRLALEDLMLHHASDLRERHSILKRRFAIPAIGVLVALTAAGGLLLTSRSHEVGGATTSKSSAVAGASVEIGTAMTIDRSTSGDTVVNFAP